MQILNNLNSKVSKILIKLMKTNKVSLQKLKISLNLNHQYKKVIIFR